MSYLSSSTSALTHDRHANECIPRQHPIWRMTQLPLSVIFTHYNTDLCLCCVLKAVNVFVERSQPEEMSRCPDNCQFIPVSMFEDSTQHQTPRLQPEEMSRCPDNCQFIPVSMFEDSTQHQTPTLRKCRNSGNNGRNCTIFGAQGDLGRPFDFSTFNLGVTSRDLSMTLTVF